MKKAIRSNLSAPARARSRNPRPTRPGLNLVQIFTLLSFVCVGVGSVVLGLVVSHSHRTGFERLERALMGDCVRRQFHRHFSPAVFEEPRWFQDPEQVRVLRESLEFAGIFRIKVYDTSGTILWSDEPRLVGKVFESNELLERALGGEIVSEIEATERSEHLYERQQARIVQEVYVPILNEGAGDVAGVIEVYREPEIYLESVRRANWRAWAVSVGGGIALYLVLLVVVRRAYHKEKRLERELQAYSDELLRETEKLNNIVDAAGAGLYVIDRDCRVVWVNNVLERWFGREEKLLGRKCADIFWGGSESCQSCPIALGFPSSGTTPDEREATLQSGEHRWFEVTATPIREVRRDVGHVLVLLVDITDRKATEGRLEQAGKMAALGELAGSVAHEINNPIGVISLRVTNLLSILGPDLEESRLRVALEEIRGHAERIGRTASELLVFSRRSIGERLQVDVRCVLKDAIHLVQHRLDQARIDLVVEEHGRPCLVEGDANALQQVFVNILNNAIDAMPSGGHLSVSARPAREAENARLGRPTVVVSVSDTGNGMPPHIREHIFDFFFTTKPKGSGTGLGLPISRRIVTQHAGEIRVESSTGKGSRFDILLPLAHPQAVGTGPRGMESMR